MRTRNVIFALAATAAVLTNCSKYPLAPDGARLLELETVWQYLKTYSIWQDSIPIASDPFAFSTPEQLFSSVNDTLHHASYTKYDSMHVPRSVKVSAVSATTAADSAVHVSVLTDSTVYVQITQFKEDTTYPAFKNALPVLARYTKIIVDLRGNGGGSIDAVDSIIEYFLPVNTAYISARYRQYDKASRTAKTVDWESWTTKHDRGSSLMHAKVAVLVNNGTASAAEILTAGLKDGRAAGADTVSLVGETTYGKGMGQIVISRTYLDKRDIMITFLRLQGLSTRTGDYHRKGIAPDVQVADSLAQDNAALKLLEPSAKPLAKSLLTGMPQQVLGGANVLIPADPAVER
jgi:Peptidase family S41/Peptidase S41 N-terminal domain